MDERIAGASYLNLTRSMGYMPVSYTHLDVYKRQRHIRLTNPVSHTDLKKMAEIYDLIVVGSDCVWNGDAFELETAYLLDFVNDSNKKGNFASSFACDDIPAEQRPVFAKYLSLFPMLSVREKRGKELIQALTGKEAQVVLDPTPVSYTHLTSG